MGSDVKCVQFNVAKLEYAGDVVVISIGRRVIFERVGCLWRFLFICGIGFNRISLVSGASDEGE